MADATPEFLAMKERSAESARQLLAHPGMPEEARVTIEQHLREDEEMIAKIKAGLVHAERTNG